jgi:hypothetical protein
VACPVVAQAHALELRLLQHLLAASRSAEAPRPVTLSLEMFETDVQVGPSGATE